MMEGDKYPFYRKLRDSIGSSEDAVKEVLRMLDKGELMFTPRHDAILRLRKCGFKAGVKVRDMSGNEGVVPPETEWGWGSYPYHLTFVNNEGRKVILTNGVYDAQILSE